MFAKFPLFFAKGKSDTQRQHFPRSQRWALCFWKWESQENGGSLRAKSKMKLLFLQPPLMDSQVYRIWQAGGGRSEEVYTDYVWEEGIHHNKVVAQQQVGHVGGGCPKEREWYFLCLPKFVWHSCFIVLTIGSEIVLPDEFNRNTFS